ncbi:MAG: hypothetical protein ACT4OY_08565 [Alphaproteobacteria bacterium]
MSRYKNHIPITEKMHETLVAHKKRTGMGATVIYKYMQREGWLLPDHKITIQRIESWFKRISKAANAKAFQAVTEAYESIHEDGYTKKIITALWKTT